MNTATIDRLRAEHHKALEQLATNGMPGLTLWRRLNRLEREVHDATTAQCNGERYGSQPWRNQESWDAYKETVHKRVRVIMGTIPEGFFVNGDARGHALKIESDKLPTGLHQDWGHYGILAPEINEE